MDDEFNKRRTEIRHRNSDIGSAAFQELANELINEGLSAREISHHCFYLALDLYRASRNSTKEGDHQLKKAIAGFAVESLNADITDDGKVLLPYLDRE